jgi:hypothetical protein
MIVHWRIAIGPLSMLARTAELFFVNDLVMQNIGHTSSLYYC